MAKKEASINLPTEEELDAMLDIASGKSASVNMDVLQSVMEGVYNGGELTLIPYVPNKVPGIYAVLTYSDNEEEYEECGWTFVDNTAISILIKLLSTECDADVKELVKKYNDYFKSDVHVVNPNGNYLLDFFERHSNANDKKLHKRIRGKAKNVPSKQTGHIIHAENIFIIEKEFPKGSVRFRLSLDDDKTVQYLRDKHFLHERKLF
ncbi:hypothetical protein AAE250_08365 [Bacteroides sp. GD17]|jgi:hypothetical protein|uniref:hypothetical protein n=1 Tax=Bacteroides sp. GD17 TaxID=3139826 RepID=UPI0025DDC38E|nr:hypothetical protein [uncultured Bacteroides sp.]